MKWIWSMILSLSLSLMVGGNSESSRVPQVAQMVTVRVRDGEQVQEMRYTDPDKMDAILLYLRNLRPGMLAQGDPERYIGRRFRITVYLSSGQKNVYYQHSGRFLSKNGKPWQVLSPGKGELLYPLVMGLPADRN